MGMEKGMKSAGFSPQIKNYVFSRHPREAAMPTFEFVNEQVKPFAQRLRAQPGRNIWMMGSGEIIVSFLDQDEIDEFRIHVIPILIGEGISLIQPRHRSVHLKLLSTKFSPTASSSFTTAPRLIPEARLSAIPEPRICVGILWEPGPSLA
jgi:dihydrofolate reductase